MSKHEQLEIVLAEKLIREDDCFSALELMEKNKNKVPQKTVDMLFANVCFDEVPSLACFEVVKRVIQNFNVSADGIDKLIAIEEKYCHKYYGSNSHKHSREEACKHLLSLFPKAPLFGKEKLIKKLMGWEKDCWGDHWLVDLILATAERGISITAKKEITLFFWKTSNLFCYSNGKAQRHDAISAICADKKEFQKMIDEIIMNLIKSSSIDDAIKFIEEFGCSEKIIDNLIETMAQKGAPYREIKRVAKLRKSKTELTQKELH